MDSQRLVEYGTKNARAAHSEHAAILERGRLHYAVDDDYIRTPRTLEDATSKWEEAVAAASLLGFSAGLHKIAHYAHALGAMSQETAVEVTSGLTVYALPQVDGMIPGFVISQGEDTFVTSFLLPSKTAKGDRQACEAITVCRLGAAGEDDAKTMDDMASGKGMNWFHAGLVASVQLFEDDFGDYKMLSTRETVGMSWWPRYADMVRRPAMVVPCREWPKGPHRIGDDYTSHSVLSADGGFRGVACDARTAEMTRLVTTDALQWAVPFIVSTAATLQERGYAWPERFLQYADLDRFAFTVSSPDGRTLGVWHRNIDQFVGCNEHMTVLALDEHGTPESIAVYPTWRAADIGEILNGDEDMSLLPDEHSTPMRPSRGMLARRIAAGEPLPPAACGMDLISGLLISDGDPAFEGILDSMIYGTKTNAWAAQRIDKDKIPGYVENERVFNEVGDLEPHLVLKP